MPGIHTPERLQGNRGLGVRFYWIPPADGMLSNGRHEANGAFHELSHLTLATACDIDSLQPHASLLLQMEDYSLDEVSAAWGHTAGKQRGRDLTATDLWPSFLKILATAVSNLCQKRRVHRIVRYWAETAPRNFFFANVCFQIRHSFCLRCTLHSPPCCLVWFSWTYTLNS